MSDHVYLAMHHGLTDEEAEVAKAKADEMLKTAFNMPNIPPAVAETGKTVGRALAVTFGAAMAGAAAESAYDSVRQIKNRVARKRALDRIIQVYPSLQEVPRPRLEMMYNSVSRVAPGVATDPYLAGQLIERSAKMMHVDLDSLKSLATLSRPNQSAQNFGSSFSTNLVGALRDQRMARDKTLDRNLKSNELEQKKLELGNKRDELEQKRREFEHRQTMDTMSTGDRAFSELYGSGPRIQSDGPPVTFQDPEVKELATRLRPDTYSNAPLAAQQEMDRKATMRAMDVIRADRIRAEIEMANQERAEELRDRIKTSSLARRLSRILND